jgi:hypothetical protein
VGFVEEKMAVRQVFRFAVPIHIPKKNGTHSLIILSWERLCLNTGSSLNSKLKIKYANGGKLYTLHKSFVEIQLSFMFTAFCSKPFFRN